MKKLLCWGDSPDAGTGYGTVCKHVISAFYNSGKYDVHQLAINHHGHFSSHFKWQQMPARLADPQDLHGTKMFCSTLLKGGYDYAWIVNDIYAVAPIVTLLKEAKAKAKKFPKLIFYFPVDCAILPGHLPILAFMDHLVCYNEWSRQQVLAADPSLDKKLSVISHGTDTHNFYPQEKQLRDSNRKKTLGLDPDTYVVTTVNRNSTRKQIPYAMLAFKEFKRHVPKSVFYVHSAMKDQGGDLKVAAVGAGLGVGDILFPANYSASKPLPIHLLNNIYNFGDLFLTTHLGEGYGLTVAESISAGTPVVAPRNTSMPDLIGDNEERGYLYECKDMAWIDSSGFRPKGLLPDIVDKMHQCHREGKYGNPKIAAGVQWAKNNTWQKMTDMWMTLLGKVEAQAEAQIAAQAQPAHSTSPASVTTAAAPAPGV